jgi:hypothetical protein
MCIKLGLYPPLPLHTPAVASAGQFRNPPPFPSTVPLHRVGQLIEAALYLISPVTDHSIPGVWCCFFGAFSSRTATKLLGRVFSSHPGLGRLAVVQDNTDGPLKHEIHQTKVSKARTTYTIQA